MLISAHRRGARSLAGFSPNLFALVLLACAALGAPQSVLAQDSGRTGKQVVDAVCKTCHGSGANGAPKIGDAKAWAPRASKGLTSLTDSALKGIRNMPAHGGNQSVSDAEITRAIVYMVNESGGDWSEPIDRTKPVAQRSGGQVVQMYCGKCHESGTGGAPRVGDRDAWLPRAKPGFDSLVSSAINGHGGMPPRGGAGNLTDAEIRAAIAYMLNPSGTVATAPVAPGANPDPNHKIVGDLEIYFGFVPAETMRAKQGKGGAESTAQREIPNGEDYYHVNVSLFDSKTRQVIKDAQVEVVVADPLIGTRTKAMQPIVFNTMVSYGGYVQVQSKEVHTIKVRIGRPESLRPVDVEFNVAR